ncbi:MAG: hypothetical protein JXA67_11120 [Micromonosporaceae bacterium]|nr:hypothetical protein [Micromonosporaceae bacterium]
MSDVDLGEVSRQLGAVVEQVDAGELRAPLWLRERLRAAQVTLNMVRPPEGPGVEVESAG